MSDETTRSAATQKRHGPEPIRVREIRFCVKDGRDINLPGAGINGGKDIIQSGTKSGADLEIEYKPWLRHHHVRSFEGQGSNRKLKGECFVHESWVTWTPMPDEAP